MKKQNFFKLLSLFLVTSAAFAQVQKAQTLQVGNTSTNAQSASAALQIDSTTKGLLLPRMTQTQRNAIVSPIAGLMVWCTNCGSAGEFQGYNGTSWTNLTGGDASAIPASISGNTTCNGATISATSCAIVSGATINNDVATTLGTEYNWTGATTSGMANTSTTRALVEIGGQCWMRYNMNVTPTAFSPVPTWEVFTDVGWSGLVGGTSYPNEGILYQWSAAMNNSNTVRAQGVCPTGWHIPSDCEWMYLENSLGMSTTDQQTTGYRSSGDVDYDLSSAVASGTNNAGFSGLLAGYRHTAGTFYNRPTYGYWWSSSATGTSAIIRILTTGTRGVERNSYSIANSMSVRCLKD